MKTWLIILLICWELGLMDYFCLYFTKWLTRVNTVAGDASAIQPFSQLVCEENITKFAVAVGLKELPAVSPTAQVFTGDQCVKVNLAPLISHRGQSNNACVLALLKPIQQEARQQKMAKMVHAKLNTKSIFSFTVCYETCQRNHCVNQTSTDLTAAHLLQRFLARGPGSV